MENDSRPDREFAFWFDVTMPQEAFSELCDLIPESELGAQITVRFDGPGASWPEFHVRVSLPQTAMRVRAWLIRNKVAWLDELGETYDFMC